ncbi:MAG: phosphatase PAP2 family protein [Oscillospiraceae bacterium]|nr:phosphatase PAP2 family protein [Oscillospiraceae bacterium]
MPVWIQEIDGALLLFLQSIRLSLLDPLVLCYTHLGDAGVLWIVLSLLLLCRPKTRKAGLLALCAMALGLLCNNMILKRLVQRPRPWLVVAGLQPLTAPPDPNSFPSGHTCAAFAAALSWRHTLPWRQAGWVGVAMAVLMGFSRLYVGVHFPTDVLAGGLMGTLCAWAVWQGERTLTNRERPV